MKSRNLLRLGMAALCAAAIAHAQVPRSNPTSKIFVADTEGDTQISTVKGISTLAKKAVYKGEGTAIQTKANSNASIVLSNGTGIYFDVTTRTEIRAFVQAPFRPGRTDMEEEPSISRTHMFIDYGVVGLSTSKMAAGSTLLVETSHASAVIEGRQAVIEAGDTSTTISMLEGRASVQSSPDGVTYDVKSGYQVTIRAGKPGQENTVDVRPISDGADGLAAWLMERVLAADAARKLVYFEMQDGASDSVTLFDGESAGGLEIVPVPVAPANPPVQPTVSAANLSGR